MTQQTAVGKVFCARCSQLVTGPCGRLECPVMVDLRTQAEKDAELAWIYSMDRH
jgi:hypothetical protein